ncbi:MAG: hypothetical protein WBA84_00470 [Carnobacterium sp.]|uniref:hypothetical protein n=1 Tax=Carnobacterium sp. TaxID=48221 RepID=UPI003C79310D
MKKSFFMRIYNPTLFLLTSSILIFFVSMITKYFTICFSNSEIEVIRQLTSTTMKINMYSNMVSFSLLIITLSLVILELYNRFKNDKIGNYFKSLYKTMLLRYFLVQTEITEKVITIENQSITTSNPINYNFNRSVKKGFVDIRQETVTIFLKVPRSQQAQKLLKEMEPQIKEEISSRNQNYYFSSPTRVNNSLWFEGKKR